MVGHLFLLLKKIKIKIINKEGGEESITSRNHRKWRCRERSRWSSTPYPIQWLDLKNPPITSTTRTWKRKSKIKKEKRKQRLNQGVYKSVRDITSVERGRRSSNSRKRSLKLEPLQIRCREAQPPLPSKPTHSLSYTHTYIHTFIFHTYINTHVPGETKRRRELRRAEIGRRVTCWSGVRMGMGMGSPAFLFLFLYTREDIFLCFFYSDSFEPDINLQH